MTVESVNADPMPLYGVTGVGGIWPKLLLRARSFESRPCLCGDEEPDVLMLWAMYRGPELEEPADMEFAVVGDGIESLSKDVCKGAGRGVKLLDDENLFWLALRFAVPGLMTSLTSASSRSMLSSEFSLVMMDISNSFSTWMPPRLSLTLVKPLSVPVAAVEPVMAVVPVMAVLLLAWRDEMTVIVPDLALCMGSPPLPSPVDWNLLVR